MENFDFDINNGTKKMPYAPLPEGFFESFNADTMARIKREEVRDRKRWSLLLSSSMAVAASVAVILVSMLIDSPTERAINAFDNNLNLYVEALSDEELTSFYYEIESVEEFYANL